MLIINPAQKKWRICISKIPECCTKLIPVLEYHLPVLWSAAIDSTAGLLSKWSPAWCNPSWMQWDPIGWPHWIWDKPLCYSTWGGSELALASSFQSVLTSEGNHSNSSSSPKCWKKTSVLPTKVLQLSTLLSTLEMSYGEVGQEWRRKCNQGKVGRRTQSSFSEFASGRQTNCARPTICSVPCEQDCNT